MYQALVERDATFDGLFIFAVKTTGVFCKPSCPARSPRDVNVEYFATAREAMRAGYRPCKRCQPLATAGAAPEWAARLIEMIEAARDRKISDADVRALDVDPATARRFFQARFGMSFQEYQRAWRLGRALAALRSGLSATRAAIDSGFESESGFRDAFVRTFGCPPSRADEVRCLFASWIDTPLGTMVAAADDEALALLEFVDGRTLHECGAGLVKLGMVLAPGRNGVLERIERELGAYFEVAQLSELCAKRTNRSCRRDAPDLRGLRSGVLTTQVPRHFTFSVPLALHGTEFQTAVWRELLTIPYGETRSYADIARAVGKPSAVRAVGAANGRNRIAIVIPCHRVVRSDGALCGYAGGEWRKEWLLEHETSIQSA